MKQDMAKDKGLSQHPAHAYHKKQKRETIKKARLEKSRSKRIHSTTGEGNSVQEQIRTLLDLKRENRLNAHDARLLSTLQRENQDPRASRRSSSKPLIQSEKQSEKSQRSMPDIASDVYQIFPRAGAYRSASVSSISTDSSVAAIAMPDEDALLGSEAQFADPRSQLELTKIDESARLDPAVQPVEYYSAPQIRDLHKEAIIFKPKAIHSSNMTHASRKIAGEQRLEDPTQQRASLGTTQYKRIDIAP